jgi:hypothetical protein
MLQNGEMDVGLACGRPRPSDVPNPAGRIRLHRRSNQCFTSGAADALDDAIALTIGVVIV